MKKAFFYGVSVLLMLSFSGCSMIDMISIGKTHTKAEEDGLDYEDTGAVASPYFLYENRRALNPAVIYPNSNCRAAKNEKILIGGED